MEKQHRPEKKYVSSVQESGFRKKDEFRLVRMTVQQLDIYAVRDTDLLTEKAYISACGPASICFTNSKDEKFTSARHSELILLQIIKANTKQKINK